MNRRTCNAIGTAVLAAALLPQSLPAAASPADGSAPASTIPSPATGAIPQADRAAVFGDNYQESSDLLWVLTPSDQGLALMTATVASGGAWQTAATLSVAGVDSRQWIGQGCVLQGTHVAAVAFGPIEYISTSRLFESGAFAGLVNLDTGAVTYVPDVRPTFSYFSPMCGTDGTAEYTAFGEEESTTTVWRVTEDGATNKLVDDVAGEYTQVVEAPQGAFGMKQGQVLQVSKRLRPASACSHQAELRRSPTPTPGDLCIQRLSSHPVLNLRSTRSQVAESRCTDRTRRPARRPTDRTSFKVRP